MFVNNISLTKGMNRFNERKLAGLTFVVLNSTFLEFLVNVIKKVHKSLRPYPFKVAIKVVLIAEDSAQGTD